MGYCWIILNFKLNNYRDRIFNNIYWGSSKKEIVGMIYSFWFCDVDFIGFNLFKNLSVIYEVIWILIYF